VIQSGAIVVDKPAGWTSHDVVGKMRRLAGERSIGHLGTLDPMATGVLPLLVGNATRLARFFTTNEKRYDGVVRLGVTTDSYDREGAVTWTADRVAIGREELEAALDRFRGTFWQTPPPVSAKKVGGTPAYKLARQKIAFELKPVEVTVFSIELREFDGACARLLVHCGGGTYIRSIAHELGQALGCGAMLESLRRTSSGGFREAQALSLEALQELAAARGMQQAVIPAAELLPEIPAECVDAATEGQIRQGRDFRVSPFRVRLSTQFVKAVGESGELVAIGEVKLPNVYHPILVLNHV
jgi:tRNA pseudouridine55 synthase